MLILKNAERSNQLQKSFIYWWFSRLRWYQGSTTAKWQWYLKFCHVFQSISFLSLWQQWIRKDCSWHCNIITRFTIFQKYLATNEHIFEYRNSWKGYFTPKWTFTYLLTSVSIKNWMKFEIGVADVNRIAAKSNPTEVNKQQPPLKRIHAAPMFKSDSKLSHLHQV